jgi:uncharacterized membrane protein
VKKARYAFAAAGVAPALGLLAPAATAAPAITHAQAGLAKTVRLSHAATPQYTCHPGKATSATSNPHHLFKVKIINYGHCVGAQNGSLQAAVNSLSERIRGYSQYGTMTFNHRVKGKTTGVGPSRTLFPNSDFSALNWNPVYQICAALVTVSTNSVFFGPVCFNT